MALAINLSGNQQTFSIRLKFSILKPAATPMCHGITDTSVVQRGGRQNITNLSGRCRVNTEGDGDTTYRQPRERSGPIVITFSEPSGEHMHARAKLLPSRKRWLGMVVHLIAL